MLSPAERARYADAAVRACVRLKPGDTLFVNAVPAHRELAVALAEAAYRAGARYVDVTRTTGGYRTLTDLTEDARYGQIPASVAEVCTLTYYCDRGDVHPTPAGHQAIADAVIAASR